MRSSAGKISKFARKLLIAAFISFFVLIFAGVLFYNIEPVSFRLFVFQPVRDVFFFQRELEALNNWNKIERVSIPTPESISIPPTEKSKIKIVADLRVPDTQGLSPAILLLHGSSPWGRKNGLMMLLAVNLQSKGWVVLSPDARGFGDTEDPANIEDPESWSVRDDIQRCLSFLIAHPKTDPNRIYVLGHSLGAGQALEGALDDDRVKALVLIGPPRFYAEVKITNWGRTRFSGDRKLKHPISKQVILDRYLRLDISHYLENELNKDMHLPILLIDGEKESAGKTKFLSSIADKIHPPLTYRTLKDTGHYCGVYNLFGSRIVYYRPDMFNPFMEILLNFFNETVKTN